MDEINFFLVISLAIALFLIGQVIRALRWQLLIPRINDGSKTNLLYAIGIGTLINFLLPFHLGEIQRILLLKKISGIPINFGIGSIIIERLSDFLVVLILAFVIYGVQVDFISINKIHTLLFFCFACFTLLAFKLNKTRSFFNLIGGIFNKQIQSNLLYFIWNFNVQINNILEHRLKYFYLTVLMWSGYFGSLYILNEYFEFNFFKIFYSDYPLLTLIEYEEIRTNLWIWAYIILIIYIPIQWWFLRHVDSKARTFLSQKINYSFFGIGFLAPINRSFVEYLENYFANKSLITSRNIISAFNNCRIISFFEGGSNAIIAVIENEGEVKIRKVLPKNDYEKLKYQYEWIINNQSQKILPITKVIQWLDLQDFCGYEMPYNQRVLSMYDWIHKVPEHIAKNLFLNIINKLHQFHEANSIKKISDKQKVDYVNFKLIKNISIIKSLASVYININNFYINGLRYSFKEWDFLSSPHFVSESITLLDSSHIHGDFTIDNIVIVDKDYWYAIDPNFNVEFSSPLLDWAKLLQSLGGNYEYYIRNDEYELNLDGYYFHMVKSHQYELLYHLLKEKIEILYGSRGYYEARLHELIHMIRLLPYKFNKSPKQGMLFVALTTLAIRRFREDFDIA